MLMHRHIPRCVPKALAVIIGISLACILSWRAEAGGSRWDDAAIPRSLRDVLHTSAAMVPPFEHEDSTLTDPKRWPESREFAGRQCELSIFSTSNDAIRIHKFLSTVRPGERGDCGGEYGMNLTQ